MTYYSFPLFKLNTTSKYKKGHCFLNRFRGKVRHFPSLLLSFSGAHLADAQLNLFQKCLTLFIFASGIDIEKWALQISVPLSKLMHGTAQVWEVTDDWTKQANTGCFKGKWGMPKDGLAAPCPYVYPRLSISHEDAQRVAVAKNEEWPKAIVRNTLLLSVSKPRFFTQF